MSIGTKLQKWTRAGLITADQQARILEYEKISAGNRWRLGLAGAGLISILLGIALIVAANWQDIPWQAKLAVHFIVNATLTFLVFRWWHEPARDHHREIALGALWGLTLTFIALMGQTFQLGGQAYEALRLWFWLTTPMILLFAQSRGIARLWAVAFVFYVPYDIISWTLDNTINPAAEQTVVLATAILVPLGAWAIGAVPRLAVNRPTIARMLRRLGMLLAFATGLAAGVGYYGRTSFEVPMIAVLMAGIVILARQVLRKWHPGSDDRSNIDILCLSALFVCLPFIAPIKSDVVAAVHFIALCLLAGALFQQQGRSNLVSLMISLVTLRLFVVFIELFGTMMMSGFGLIAAGLILMGLVRMGKHLDKILKARLG
jgi:uncharacterized membrane protein